MVLTTANIFFWGGGVSNFCQYYARSQTGKSTGYRPTLKPLTMHEHVLTGTDQEFYFALQGIDIYAGK